jgi:hypothetical protein
MVGYCIITYQKQTQTIMYTVHMYYLYTEFLSKYQSSVSHQRICGLNQMKALLQRKIRLNYIFTDSIKFQWHGKITNFIHISNWQSRKKVWQVNLSTRVPNPHKFHEHIYSLITPYKTRKLPG